MTQLAEMDLGSGDKAYIPLKDKFVDRFGVVPATVDSELVERTRKAHTRTIYDGLTNNVDRTTNVPLARWLAASGGVMKEGSGVAVQVPIDLKYANGTDRYTVIRVPQGATQAAVGNFLHDICVNHKPDHFINERGVRHPVIKATGDVNPGNNSSDDPPASNDP